MARKRIYPASVDPGIPRLPASPPDGWSRRSFGDAVKQVSRPVKLAPDREYRLVVAKRNRGGIQLRGILSGGDIKTKTQFMIDAGDFLISRRQIIHGACGVVPPELAGSVVSNEYASLSTRDCLEMEYLRYFSSTPYFRRTTFHSSHGVDVEKMIFKIKEWLERPVDLPPLGEQRKIAAILGSVDALIERTQAVIDQLEVVKKGLMQELLTRGLPGRHTRFKQTEIGEIPESWEVRPVSDMGEVKAGKAKNPNLKAPSRPYLRTKNVYDGCIRIEDVYHMPFTDKEFEVYRVRPGDILLNEGQDISLVGRCSMYRGEFPGDCAIQNQLIRFRASKGVYPDFAEQLMRWHQISGKFSKIATQTTSIAHLGVSRFASVVMGWPSYSEQVDIAEILGCFDQRRGKSVTERAGLETLKSALSTALLSGQLRVTPDQEPNS